MRTATDTHDGDPDSPMRERRHSMPVIGKSFRAIPWRALGWITVATGWTLALVDVFRALPATHLWDRFMVCIAFGFVVLDSLGKAIELVGRRHDG